MQFDCSICPRVPAEYPKKPNRKTIRGYTGNYPKNTPKTEKVADLTEYFPKVFAMPGNHPKRQKNRPENHQ